MSTHISEELPRLLTGEAPRDVVMAAAAHLRSCADCQQELVSAVVAHASLISAKRFAPEVVQSAGQGDREGDEAAAPAPVLPDLSAVFAQIRDERALPAASRRVRRRTLIAAAAALVLAGGGAAIATLATGSSAPQTVTVALEPVGAGKAAATATLIGSDHMRIDATSLPQLDARHHYEVWLTNTGDPSPQAVGFIGADRRADITVPTALMGAYHDIAVSVQGLHQTQFSGRPVLLGKYA